MVRFFSLLHWADKGSNIMNKRIVQGCPMGKLANLPRGCTFRGVPLDKLRQFILLAAGGQPGRKRTRVMSEPIAV